MEQVKPQISERQSDSKRIQDYVNFQAIENHNGWLVYKRELEKFIDDKIKQMDNPYASGDLLIKYQCIKMGLIMARDIPKTLEIKAKSVRKNEQKKRPSRIDNFFRVGK